ncbi:MAG: O-antigen ligase family protein, partial [Rhodospirillaceae bacterium]|nr:O-antigen ligase family protein [Rhodospirillaceae bacterium]
RAVFAGLAAALLATAVVRRALRPLAAAAVLAGILYLGLVAIGALPPPGLLDRGDSHRLLIWQQAWALALQRPWFGYGVNFPIAFAMPEGDVIHHTHSAYLAHLVLGGVAGLALYLALLALMASAALARYRRDGNFANAALTIFIAVHGAFDFSAFVENAGWQWIHFWLPLGLMAGGELAAARADEDRPAPAAAARA